MEGPLLNVWKSKPPSLLEDSVVLRACGKGATQAQEMSEGIWQQCLIWQHKPRCCWHSTWTALLPRQQHHQQQNTVTSPPLHLRKCMNVINFVRRPLVQETLGTRRAKSQPAFACISWGLLKSCANPVKAFCTQCQWCTHKSASC